MEASVTIELTAITVSVDGEEVLAIDKLNSIYRVNGTDVMASISELT